MPATALCHRTGSRSEQGSVNCAARHIGGQENTVTRVAVAASSSIAAEAGIRIAAEGGNAVDAAVASTMVSLATEPGVVSPAAGGFATVWPAQQQATVFDGVLTMPGNGIPPDRFGRGAWEVHMTYGGGMSTVIGHGSVATPGGFAMLESCWREYGSLPWEALMQPAYEHARDGFPLGQASYNYLVHCGESVFSWHEDSRKALFDEDGTLKPAGALIHVPHLDETLKRIADEGVAAFYTGEIARRIVADMEANEGLVNARDLAGYELVRREPLCFRVADWTIATNPPPAVGGAALCAMLELMEGRPHGAWTAADVARAAEVQNAVYGYRRSQLDLSEDIATDIAQLLQLCRDNPHALLSPSTIHVSSVDADGLACSTTMSAGYSSGVMPPGTGLWMNNGLGELELNKRGLVPGPPGTRLTSNMAPSVARSDAGSVLAIGSPGADRITTAISLTLLNLVHAGLTLEAAIEHPRLHVEFADAGPRIALEPGLDSGDCRLPLRQFDSLSMFFGGVGAAQLDADGRMHAASDSRRTGGARVGG
ncbi:MAG: gamma-glutamyltransferase [Gammaproteobacteria bacterium]|nr:gamma-glutamyltransferase [Gammaproteobacteria bacterium]NNF61048.1 gamma-glutamyltransferase [Gammaproteobacteria bacterium]NNM21439.1 gamma-glutamyltransferase [Gammaproteobacteria bacterium]